MQTAMASLTAGNRARRGQAQAQHKVRIPRRAAVLHVVVCLSLSQFGGPVAFAASGPTNMFCEDGLLVALLCLFVIAIFSSHCCPSSAPPSRSVSVTLLLLLLPLLLLLLLLRC